MKYRLKGKIKIQLNDNTYLVFNRGRLTELSTEEVNQDDEMIRKLISELLKK